jgi:hypothetical protein
VAEDVSMKDSNPPCLSVTVKNADGEIIRVYKTDVHQGVNRLLWDMQRDGIKPVSPDEYYDPDNGLPAGPSVLPGSYEITIELDDSSANAVVEVLKDPRNPYSRDALQANYNKRLALMALQDSSNAALRQILAAREDVETTGKLIARQLEQEKTDELKTLKKQAVEVKKGLDELEKLYWTPENTTGITYDGDTVNSKLGNAAYYVGSGDGAPSPTSETYVEMARSSLAAATERVNAFMANELTMLRENVDKAGISPLNIDRILIVPE